MLKCLCYKKAEFTLKSGLITVILFTALLNPIVILINEASNLSFIEKLLLRVIILILTLGIVYMIGIQTNIIKKK